MPLDRRTRLFVVLCSVFVVALVVSDIIGTKLVTAQLFGFGVTLTVGMIPFPLTFVLTDILNEFYGKEAARFITLVGLGMAAFSYTVIAIAVALPISPLASAPGFKGVTEGAFRNVFSNSQRMLVASLIAYVIGQLVDISVFHWLRQRTGHRFLWLRSTGSTVISQLVDTLAIQSIAWYGILAWHDVVPIAITSYVTKALLALLLTPVIYLTHGFVLRWLKAPTPQSVEPPLEAA